MNIFAQGVGAALEEGQGRGARGDDLAAVVDLGREAARGTDERLYPWGNEIDNTRANFTGSGSEGGDTMAVGSFIDGASPYGVLDMAGNVWEWVADEYDYRYYYNSPSENPPGPTLTETRYTVRGGSWDGTVNSMRIAHRYGMDVDYTNFPIGGIRCAALP